MRQVGYLLELLQDRLAQGLESWITYMAKAFIACNRTDQRQSL